MYFCKSSVLWLLLTESKNLLEKSTNDDLINRDFPQLIFTKLMKN